MAETLWMEWRARAQELGVSDVDLLTTFTELTCKQIALACKNFGGENIVGTTGDSQPSTRSVSYSQPPCVCREMVWCGADDVIMRGGVANNGYFMERMSAQMSEQLGKPVNIRTLDEIVSPPRSIDCCESR